jgi:hypothetical protein
MLSCSHQTREAASSSVVGECERTGGYVGRRSGRGVTPRAGGLVTWPICPRYKISERTLLFHAPKSDRPVRIGICETEGKALVEEVGKIGTVGLVTGVGGGG